MQGEFGARWRTTFYKILKRLAFEVSLRLDELEPDKTREDRRKILTQLASFCASDPQNALNGPIVSDKALRAVGYQDDVKADTRIIWLLTAFSYVSISSLLVKAGRDAAAMHSLVEAKYWLGFQDSGHLRKFVEEDTIRNVGQSVQRAGYARIKHAKEAERDAAMLKHVRTLLQKRRDWPTRQFFTEHASLSLIDQFPDHFTDIAKNIIDETEKADRILKESERLAKKGYKIIPDPGQYFKRNNSKSRSH